MKSDSANGTRSGRPCPQPVPNRPPLAMPNRPRTSWPEPPGLWSKTAGSNACSQASNRAPTCENALAARTAPTTNSSEADDDPAQPLGGQVEHGDEQAEEQQRGAEVALEDEDRDRRAPHDEDRAEVPRPRQLQAQHLRPGEREGVAVGDQVARRRRWRTRSWRTPPAGSRPRRRAPRCWAPLMVTPEARDQRQQDQHETGDHRGVGVAAQGAVVAQQDDDRGREDHRDRRPHQLTLREPCPHGRAPRTRSRSGRSSRGRCR